MSDYTEARDEVTADFENEPLYISPSESQSNAFYIDTATVNGVVTYNLNVGFGFNITGNIGIAEQYLEAVGILSSNPTIEISQWATIQSDALHVPTTTGPDIALNNALGAASTVTQTQAYALMDNYYTQVAIPRLNNDLTNIGVNTLSVPLAVMAGLQDLKYNANAAISGSEVPNLNADLIAGNWGAAAYDVGFNPNTGVWDRREAESLVMLGFNPVDGKTITPIDSTSVNLSTLVQYEQRVATGTLLPYTDTQTALLSYLEQQGLYVPQRSDASATGGILQSVSNLLAKNGISISAESLQAINQAFPDGNIAVGGLMYVPTSALKIGPNPVTLPQLTGNFVYVFDPSSDSVYTVGADLKTSNAGQFIIDTNGLSIPASLISSLFSGDNAVTLTLDNGTGATTDLTLPTSSSTELFAAGIDYQSILNLNPGGAQIASVAYTGSALQFDLSQQVGGLPLALLSNADGSYNFGLDPVETFQNNIGFAANGLNGSSIAVLSDGTNTILDTEIGSGATVQVDSFNSLSGIEDDFTFLSSSGTLEVNAGLSFTGTIYGAVTGDLMLINGATEISMLHNPGYGTPDFEIEDQNGGISTFWFPDLTAGDFGYVFGRFGSALGVEITRGSAPASTLVSSTAIAPEAGETEQLSAALANLGSLGSVQSISIFGNGTVALTGESASVADLTVTDGGTLALTDGTLSTDPITIDAGGNLFGSGEVDGAETTNGFITAQGGLLDLTGNIIGTGLLDVDSGATLEVDGTVASTAAITFSGTDADLVLGTTAVVAASVNGFAAGDAIGIKGETITGLTFDTAANELTLTTDGNITKTLFLNGTYSASDFIIENGEVIDNALCLVKGTPILTSRGEVAVENLRIGDMLITQSGEKSIRWIGERVYDGKFIEGNPLALPVCIKQNALGGGVPARDMEVSPGHGIMVGNHLVPAWRLVNGVSITQAKRVDWVDYYNIEMDNHEAIFAAGCWVESFNDDNGKFRHQFHNAYTYKALYPTENGRGLFVSLPRLESGKKLRDIQNFFAVRAGVVLSEERAADTLRGYIDTAGPRKVIGWAQAIESPDAPVALDIWVGGQLIKKDLLANAYRSDLRDAEIGKGCYGFEIDIPEDMSGRVEVRRSLTQDLLLPTDALRAKQAQTFLPEAEVKRMPTARRPRGVGARAEIKGYRAA